jgi:Protein of unknown function (DUF429)
MKSLKEHTLLLGCDFTSRPTRKKPIVLAQGFLVGDVVSLERLDRFEADTDFLAALQSNSSWVGGFDLPFGLPRELVQTLGWPQDWLACMDHFCSLSREEIRLQFKAFCDARPVGQKFAHRQTDLPAQSSPSMKWVNPPVAYMMHAGVPLLLKAGVTLAGLHAADPSRVALEAYPGFFAKSILGGKSYKSDDVKKQTPDRLIARKDIVHALELGRNVLDLRLKLSHALREALIEDASGDALDAVICCAQAGWAQKQHLSGHSLYGLPKGLDALEGWIVGVPAKVGS